MSAAEVLALSDYVDAGGGLVIGETGWAWGGGFADFTVDFPANRILEGAGLTILADVMWGLSTTQPIAPTAPTPLSNAFSALQALVAHFGPMPLSTVEVETAVATVLRAVPALSLAGFAHFYAEVDNLLMQYPVPVIPTDAQPVSATGTPLDAVYVSLTNAQAVGRPAASVTAHPAAVDFPGVPGAGATLVTKTLDIDADNFGPDTRNGFAHRRSRVWRSTGLYASPGSPISVTVPASATAAGLGVRIGSHSDRLFHLDPWRRYPDITRHELLESSTTTVANGFGGLVYITVPRDATVGVISVTITGAVQAPRYVHGETSLADWVATERHHAAPWGELESDKVIITVRSADLATLDDPIQLMNYWDSVLDSQATLASLPTTRAAPERITVDRQISAGYLHAGYPIMGHLVHGPPMVNAISASPDEFWGYFHEFGHNHQVSDWVLPNTGEVNVNLFTLYSYETVLGIPIDAARDNFAAADRAQIAADYVQNGTTPDTWGAFTGLVHYVQLVEGFGWQAFMNVFDTYRQLSESERPQDDQEKIDLWMVLFSEEVGRNLEPFFTAWRWTTTQAAKDQIANLPLWIEDPMRAHYPIPPVFSTDEAIHVGGTTAHARYTVEDPGSPNATFLLGYGTTDGGAALSAWDHVVVLGQKAPGAHTQFLTGLTDLTRIYYRVFVTSSMGLVPAENSESFVTLVSAPFALFLGSTLSDASPVSWQDDIILVDPLLTWDITSAPLPSFDIPPTATGFHAFFQVVIWNPIQDPSDPLVVSNGLDVTIGVSAVPYGPVGGATLDLAVPTVPGGVLSFTYSVP